MCLILKSNYHSISNLGSVLFLSVALSRYMLYVSNDSECSITLALSFPWQRLDIDVLQRERNRSTGHVRLSSNQYIKPTNRLKLGY